MSLKWQSIVVDSVDPGPLARWWADLLGWRVTFDEPDEVVLEPPEGSPGARRPPLLSRKPVSAFPPDRVDSSPGSELYLFRQQASVV